MIYYISDMHFGHENVLRFDSRPFFDTDQMEKEMVGNWNARVTETDTVYVLGDAFWRNEENSVRIMQRLNGHKHLILGNHDRVKGRQRPLWESIEPYAEINDGNTLVILSHYPILFYKNQHYGSVMLYGHVHETRESHYVEKWKRELWEAGIPCNLINVGCMMEYMQYTPRTLSELLAANPSSSQELFRKQSDIGGVIMENYEQLLADIQHTAEKIKALQEILCSQYTYAVKEVLAGRLTDEKQIDRLNADLIDLGDDPRFHELSKRLWAAIYRNCPQLIPNGFKGMYRWASVSLRGEFRLEEQRKEDY